ncbi:hypothetical protein ASG52_20025 [Methylobacterium sp. Leaf456]|uniref:hypothetical protein n=1 Tax=Methylobacterium sp. Leaf456 TaxID=1736382 RepID=UPI000700DBDE|nr:hypothetical protein [Methylobacterium sp. Leaf456]KQT59678.1 hypothetical protein ASG52_20025 [Methylobacterium sp. Leaf456]
MRLVRKAALHLREGTSDKVYEVDLVENDAVAGPARFLVNTRHGRRGAALREGTKTAQAVSAEAAQKIFDSVVVSKLNGGYRRSDQLGDAGPSGAMPGGRDGVLLARLAACRRERWPERDRARLLWRIGQLRIAAAMPDLLALAKELGPAQAPYTLVWALDRTGGAAARPALETIAASSDSVATRDLARFALSAEAQAAADADLPDSIARPAEAGDVEALCGALDGLARTDPGRVGPALVALGRRARGDSGLHATLCAAILRLPARPPYLIGLRRLFKHAEMADDAGLFAATAYRFETAEPMYWRGGGHAYVPELCRSFPLDGLRRGADTVVGLSTVTHDYLRRRIWRALRKRGEVGDPAFAAMAADFLLTVRPENLRPRSAWTSWVRRSDGTWGREPRAYGPLGHHWTANQLLYRNAPGAIPRPKSLRFIETAEPDPESRDEAFPDLWSARPDLALRLAAGSAVAPVAMLGVRVLRADASARETLTPTELGRLLAAPIVPAQRLGFDAARDRLARGAADPELLAALIAARLPEARDLALRRIEADPALPWSHEALAFALLTSPEPEVGAAVARLAERGVPTAAATALGLRLTAWLATMPPAPDATAPAAIAALRAGLAALWPAHDLSLAREEVAPLLRHPAPEVVAAGLDLLTRSGAEADSLPPDLWDALIGSESEKIQAAAFGLLARSDDARLAAQAERVLALASGPSLALRVAARPLVVRLASLDPALAERLARDLIDTLFHTAPDDAYPGDIVALLTEAMPGPLATLDPGTVWRLTQARAKGAQLLGATVLVERAPGLFSVRQIARLGGHPHVAVRRWAMAAYEAEPARFQAEAEDAVLLIESDWPDATAFARAHFENWPEAAWTPAALAIVTDSVRPEVLAFARTLLRSRLRPGDAEAQLLRLLEHPSPSMHLLVTEMLTEQAVASEDAFARLIPLARIVMLQVLKGRVAKDRMAAFLRAQALGHRERAERLLPLFSDLSLSGTARDRAAAILTLRDIADTHPGLDTPLARRAPETREPDARAEAAR